MKTKYLNRQKHFGPALRGFEIDIQTILVSPLGDNTEELDEVLEKFLQKKRITKFSKLPTILMAHNLGELLRAQNPLKSTTVKTKSKTDISENTLEFKP